MSNSHPPNWYPDPAGAAEYRYFDGVNWTDRVATNGRESTAPLTQGHIPRGDVSAKRIQKDAVESTMGQHRYAGGGTLFTEPVLVVNQKAKIWEMNTEYAIHAQTGQQIGAIRQVGQSGARKILRLLSNLDAYMTHRFQVVDNHGNVVLQVIKQGMKLKAKIDVLNGQGQVVGQIAQENMIGKIRFGFLVGGQRIGGLAGESWFNWDFSVTDHMNTEVARVNKKWAGLGRELFTTADNYVIQMHRPLEDPLRSLVLASALTVDQVLRQHEG